MRIEELRQALTVHYQSEGHSLLCADGSFPYSDKDIELVCGSLVCIRNGTLQVVHLIVKEYIQSCSELDSSALLAETQSASSRLAIACLSFLGSKCTWSGTTLEKSKVDLQQLRTNAPFIEYAATFWMFHLTDSAAQDSVKACEVFRSTFNSASTFCWMETYLTLHPSNLLDLFILLDAIRDWVSSLRQGCLPYEDSNLSFITNWCGVMEQVLQEYGPALVLRPHEIHHLNLSFAFSAGSLNELYEKFGNVHAGEEPSRFEISHHSRHAAREVPSHRRLHGDIEVFERRLSLFLYDSRRDVYIWSPKIEGGDEIVLFVQSASNAKRLRPIKYTVDTGKVSSRCMRYVTACDLSKDGTFLLVIIELSDCAQLTLGWQIEEQLDFPKGLNAAPWACLNIQYVLECRAQPCRKDLSIAVRSGMGFCTPARPVNSAMMNHSPTSADIIRMLPDLHRQLTLYSGNGEFVFVVKYRHCLDRAVIEKLTWTSMEKVAEFSLLEINKSALEFNPEITYGNRCIEILVETVSPSGRYLVLGYPGWEFWPPIHLILLDTISGKIIDMKHRLSRHRSISSFSDDESELNIISFDGSEMITYTGMSSVTLSKSTQVIPALRQLRLYEFWQFSSDHRLAIGVSWSGVIGRIDDKDELLDEIEMINDDSDTKCQIKVFPSQNGDRFANVELSRDGTCLQVFGTAHVGEILRHLDLDDLKPYATPFTMSPDLSILVAGEKIYNIGSPDDQIASKPSQISSIPFLKDRLCEVSPSNTFIAFYPSWTTNYDEVGLDILCLDAESTYWVHLQPSLPNRMRRFSVRFHPSLPLMAILYESPSTRKIHEDMSSCSENGPNILLFHVAIIDLNTGNIKHVDDLENPTTRLFKMLESHRFNTAHRIRSLTV